MTGALGSYAPDDVTLLLTELPDAGLELPAEVRQQLLRDGGHYAETLPIEYRPTPSLRVAVRAAAGRARRAGRAADGGARAADRGRSSTRRRCSSRSRARARRSASCCGARWRARASTRRTTASRSSAGRGHRPARARAHRRAPRARAARLHRRLDGQGRDRARAARGARRRRRRRAVRGSRPRWACWPTPGTWPTLFASRRGRADPVGVPELDRQRADQPHRDPARPARRGRVPRRARLPRVRRPRRLAALRRHDHGAAAVEGGAGRGARRRRAALRPPDGRGLRRPCWRSGASGASTTSTASSRASARRRACCCAACRDAVLVAPAPRGRPLAHPDARRSSAGCRSASATDERLRLLRADRAVSRVCRLTTSTAR